MNKVFFMKISPEEEKIQKQSIEWVKNNKKVFIQKFILDKKVLPLPAISIFMAGAPGVGKTEYVDEYEKTTDISFDKIKQLSKTKIILKQAGIDVGEYEKLFVRIDIDKIREFIPQYQKTDIQNNVKGNAHIIQPAANIALDVLRDYCIKEELSFLLDGTFGNQCSTFEKMMKKLINQERRIIIFFIYSHPVVAWRFTQKREFIEGRNITKENFIKQYLKSMDNIRRIKNKFDKEIILNLVLKNDENKKEKVYFNKTYVEVEKILKLRYNTDKFTEEYLIKTLK